MWMTIKNYSLKKQITDHAVRKRLKKGNLQSKIINNKIHVWFDEEENENQDLEKIETPTDPSQLDQDSDSIQLSWQQSLAEKTKIDNELKKERLANLKQDTILKKQKNQFVKEKYRQDFATGVLQCFVDSFGDAKNFLIELKMTKDQKQRFQKTFADGIQKFKKKLTKWLKESDQKQENETE